MQVSFTLTGLVILMIAFHISGDISNQDSRHPQQTLETRTDINVGKVELNQRDSHVVNSDHSALHRRHVKAFKLSERQGKLTVAGTHVALHEREIAKNKVGIDQREKMARDLNRRQIDLGQLFKEISDQVKSKSRKAKANKPSATTNGTSAASAPAENGTMPAIPATNGTSAPATNATDPAPSENVTTTAAAPSENGTTAAATPAANGTMPAIPAANGTVPAILVSNATSPAPVNSIPSSVSAPVASLNVTTMMMKRQTGKFSKGKGGKASKAGKSGKVAGAAKATQAAKANQNVTATANVAPVATASDAPPSAASAPNSAAIAGLTGTAAVDALANKANNQTSPDELAAEGVSRI